MKSPATNGSHHIARGGTESQVSRSCPMALHGRPQQEELMQLDATIAGWVAKVPNHQWSKEDDRLMTIGPGLPQPIVESHALAEVHRLDLSLFVIFEEAALRVSGALTRSAPTLDAMNFAAQQTLDEARHREIFWQRLCSSCRATGIVDPQVSEAIMIPPLQRFLEQCYEVVDRGEFIEGMTIMNLVFEGMAYPLYAYEQRYWAPVDPYLALLIRSAFADESRHVVYGAKLINSLLQDDSQRKAKVSALCHDATLLMAEVFDYYIRKFVKLFDTVASMHKDIFADAEFAPGRLISQTPYEEQIRTIHESIRQQHGALLERAGLT